MEMGPSWRKASAMLLQCNIWIGPQSLFIFPYILFILPPMNCHGIHHNLFFCKTTTTTTQHTLMHYIVIMRANWNARGWSWCRLQMRNVFKRLAWLWDNTFGLSLTCFLYETGMPFFSGFIFCNFGEPLLLLLLTCSTTVWDSGCGSFDTVTHWH